MSYLPQLRASKKIVIDANIAARAVVRLADSVIYLALLEKWHEEYASIFAPAFWEAEVVSVIRQYVYRKEITPPRAHDAIDDFFDLRVEVVPLDKDLCQRALDWAEAIGQSKVYDSLYLALAERLNADFWTADRRLANAARAAGAKWVHWAGEV
jgi:predicted nucleic acid-binding protein